LAKKTPPPPPTSSRTPPALGTPPDDEIRLFSQPFSVSFREKQYRRCDPVAVEIWLKLMGETSLEQAIDRSAQWEVAAPKVEWRSDLASAGTTAIGLDLGGTQLKIVGIQDGVWKAENLHPWSPDQFQSFETFEKEIEGVLVSFLRQHAAVLKGPISHFGISCAGVVRNGRIIASNLFRGIPEENRTRELAHFLIRTAEKWCPIGSRSLLGDGMAMALGAGLDVGDGNRTQAIRLRQTGTSDSRLVFALGTSVACGFVHPSVAWENYLNEISFLTFDPKGEVVDPWSGRKGTISQMASGTWVRRALESGMDLPLVYEELGSRWKPLLKAFLKIYPPVEEIVFLGGALSVPGAKENFLRGLHDSSLPLIRVPSGFSRDLPYLAAIAAACSVVKS
jgi:hypothetical protein